MYLREILPGLFLAACQHGVVIYQAAQIDIRTVVTVT
jgi:hypothetical protein